MTWQRSPQMLKGDAGPARRGGLRLCDASIRSSRSHFQHEISPGRTERLTGFGGVIEQIAKEFVGCDRLARSKRGKRRRARNRKQKLKLTPAAAVRASHADLECLGVGARLEQLGHVVHQAVVRDEDEINGPV